MLQNDWAVPLKNNKLSILTIPIWPPALQPVSHPPDLVRQLRAAARQPRIIDAAHPLPLVVEHIAHNEAGPQPRVPAAEAAAGVGQQRRRRDISCTGGQLVDA